MKKIFPHHYFFILLLTAVFPLNGVGKETQLRIVSLAPALSEMVCALGGEKMLVARSSACDYPTSLKKLPVAGSFGRPEVERIMAQRPDWVIGNDLMNPNVSRILKNNRIKSDFRQIKNSNDYIFWLKLIGKTIKQEKAAADEIQRFKNSLAELDKLPQLPLKALWIVNEKPLMVAGPGSLPDEALKLMKVKNAAANVPDEYFKCSVEWLLTAKIDIIIWGLPGMPDAKNPLWSKVQAVQQKKIVTHALDDPVTRPGPRFAPALINMRKKIEKSAGK